MYRTPTNGESPLLIVASNDRVMAYRRSDGALAWAYQFSVPSNWRAEPADHLPLALEFLGERLFLARTASVVCLEYATGKILGEVGLAPSQARPQMLIDGGKLFVVAEHDVYCIDPSGALLWQTAHGIPSVNGSPSVGFPGNVRQGDTVGWK